MRSRCSMFAASLIALGCGGGSATTADTPSPTPPVEPAAPAPVRVELGRCTTRPVPFASGMRPRRSNVFGLVGPAANPGGKGKRPSGPTVRLAPVTANGSLDKNIIRRYIRRNIAKLRLCYERQLLVNPSLAGTVTARFTIDQTGKVIRSTAAGLDPKVDRCVADVIAAITFPAPKGGGLVNVVYPFRFKAASSGSSPPKPAPEVRQAGILGKIAVLSTFESPLGPARSAIERCAQQHLDGGHGSDALVVDLGGKAGPRTRSSASRRELERCIDAAIASIKAKEGRCPIALGTAEPRSLTRIVLDRGSVRFSGESIGALDHGAETALPKLLAAYRGRLVAPGFTPAVARLGPLVLEVSGETELRDVREVVALVERADLHAALAVAGRPALLRRGALPWVPVPTSSTATAPGSSVRIRVSRDLTMAVQSSGGGSAAVVLDRAHLAAQLGAALADWRARSLVEPGAPVAITADRERRFSELVAIVEALAGAGFHNWDLE